MRICGLYLALAVGFAAYLGADDRHDTVDGLLSSGRSALIERAVVLMEKAGDSIEFNRDDFPQVSVVTDGETVIVKFSMPIRYMPLGSKFSYGAHVNLIEEEITAAVNRTVHMYPAVMDRYPDIVFYKPTASDEKKIQRILDRTDLSAQSIREYSGFDTSYVEIRQKMLTHEVIYRSDYSYAFYRIGSLFGIVWKSSYESLEPAPDNEFREVE